MKVVAILINVFLLASHVRSECILNTAKDLSSKSPLLTSKDHEILRPSKLAPKTLTIESNQNQKIFCPHGLIKINEQVINRDSLSITCDRNSQFKLGNNVLDFQDISCSREIEAITRELQRSEDCPRATHVEIGFNLTAKEFKKTMDVCFDEKMATTNWARSTVTASVEDGKQTGGGSPSFKKGNYFKNVKISNVYSTANQHETLMKIFDNNQELVNKYIPKKGGNYFVKGHLVARADQFYFAEQNSTYFYVNVLPMWQTINNGNWKVVENLVRRVAGSIGDLDVWTGGLDVLKLSGKAIYLAEDKNTKKSVIPSPKLLYKLVFSNSTGQGLVFVTANNPFLEMEDLEDYLVCKNAEYKVCQSKNPKLKDFGKGYTYCCLYKDFMKNPLVSKVGLPEDLKIAKPLTI